MTGPVCMQVLRRASLLIVLCGFVVRWVLLAALTPANAFEADWEALTTVFLVGTGRDLLVAGTAAGLIAITARAGHKLLQVLLALIAALTIIIVAAELFFWSEFQSRPDRLVFHYLSYPKEVLTFLQDQFFVSLLLLPLGALSAALYTWLYRPMRSQVDRASAVPGAAGILIALLALGGMALTTLASGLTGRIQEQLASNALHGIISAALTDVHDWESHYPTANTTTPPPTFVSQRPWSDPPKHLVLIIEESFAGVTWRDPALRAQYLPEFNALAQRGWYFSNAFASGSRTTRGMEALLNGMLPLPGVATSQRPQPERLPSLPRALGDAGWHSAFIYAGWPDFSDLSAYWRAIGFNASTSREDFELPEDTFATSWGYPDEVLFDRVLQEMNRRTQEHERVFLGALTVSHHRPFDYPKDRISWPADQRRSDHAMAYADWALGRFMRGAAETAWYQDTLFIIAADHGARFHGNAPIPVNSYRVPVLFYAPGRTSARRLDHLTSLIEVPGTVLDLLGVSDTEGFTGTHMLDASSALVPVEHDYDVGLIDGDGVTVLRHSQPTEAWYWQPGSQPLKRGPVSAQSEARTAQVFQQAHQRYFKSAN